MSTQATNLASKRGVEMRLTHLKPDDLMGPDLLSEFVIALGGAIFFFLLLTLIAALAAN